MMNCCHRLLQCRVVHGCPYKSKVFDTFLFLVDTKRYHVDDANTTNRMLFLLFFPRFFAYFLYKNKIKIGASGPGGPEFAKFAEETKASHGVEFFTSLADLPPVPEGVKRLALISGRTADNPTLLKQAIDVAGCSVIYLEKPGAPTVQELADMRDYANSKPGVTVLMGYNKNVCKFVRKAREYQAQHGGHITFVSNNAYENTPESLGECFERNREGMLKNMAIHELALLVSFFDVTVENIATCQADKEFSSCQTLKGPSGADFTDFDKIKVRRNQ